MVKQRMYQTAYHQPAKQRLQEKQVEKKKPSGAALGFILFLRHLSSLSWHAGWLEFTSALVARPRKNPSSPLSLVVFTFDLSEPSAS